MIEGTKTYENLLISRHYIGNKRKEIILKNGGNMRRVFDVFSDISMKKETFFVFKNLRKISNHIF